MILNIFLSEVSTEEFPYAIHQAEQKKVNKWGKLKDPVTASNVPTFLIIKIPEGEREGAENIFENIMAGNFLNQGKETCIQVQKTQSPKHDQPKKDHTKTGYT